MVNKITESLRNEFDDRRIRPAEDYGQSVGTTMNICSVLGFIPYVGSLAGIGTLICWILYWVKIAGFNRILAEDTGRGPRDDRDDRYDKAGGDLGDDYGERFRDRGRGRDEGGYPDRGRDEGRSPGSPGRRDDDDRYRGREDPK